MTGPDGALSPERRRERDPIGAMIGIYCHDRHRRRRGLCPECGALFDYAERRLERCLFGDDKPTCARCPVHCYQPAMRERIREVMRYAGPRMTWRHPILALRHFLHGRGEAPPHPRRRETGEGCGAAAPEGAASPEEAVTSEGSAPDAGTAREGAAPFPASARPGEIR